MRTTLSLDDDVLLAVKERARRENRSAGEVLSELARQALNSGFDTDSSGQRETVPGFRPFPRRGPMVTNTLIDQLRDDESE